MYVFVLSSSINGLCHHVGYKNFENTATNIRFVALLTGGEGLHNNHHGFPRSPKFSFRPSEIDPAWPVIKLLIAAAARAAVQDHRRSRTTASLGSGSRSDLACRDRLPTPAPAGPASRTVRPASGTPLSAASARDAPATACTTSGAPPWISSHVSASRKALRMHQRPACARR